MGSHCPQSLECSTISSSRRISLPLTHQVWKSLCHCLLVREGCVGGWGNTWISKFNSLLVNDDSRSLRGHCAGPFTEKTNVTSLKAIAVRDYGGSLMLLMICSLESGRECVADDFARCRSNDWSVHSRPSVAKRDRGGDRQRNTACSCIIRSIR